MQLLYVYIGGYIDVNYGPYAGEVSDEPFKTLKNVELNFSNKFKFKFSDGVLDVEENKNYTPNFFEPKGKIKAISALIGQNGTGKTSIVEFIKWLHPDNYFKIPYKCILVYGEINHDFNQCFLIYKHHSLGCIEGKTLKNSTIQSFYHSPYHAANNLLVYNPDPNFPSIQQVFYSPIFEVKFSNIKGEQEIVSHNHFTDISTSHLLEDDAEKSLNASIFKLNAKEVFVRHKMLDSERQYEFVENSHYFEELLGFKKPNFLELIVDSGDMQFVSEEAWFLNFNKVYNECSEKFRISPQDDFIHHLLKQSLFNLVRNLPSNSNIQSKEKIVEKIIDAIPRTNGFGMLEKWIRQFKENCLSISFHKNQDLIDRFDLSLMFFDLDEVDKRFRYADKTRCRINISKELEKKIVNFYLKIKHLSGFMHFSWQYNYYNNGDLSSGEKAKINLLSRFYSVLRSAKEQGKNLENLLILIDEGDSLLHPEWQRKFLYDLIRGINHIFSKSTSIQILLTTHSPFVASDLPWYSIIKLDKDEDSGLTKIIYNNDEPTFAANIHDLFADSFFMDKGFVGEFAKEKIKSLFERIKQPSKDSILELEKEIKLIGEPFIQMSLLETLKENTTNE